MSINVWNSKDAEDKLFVKLVPRNNGTADLFLVDGDGVLRVILAALSIDGIRMEGHVDPALAARAGLTNAIGDDERLKVIGAEPAVKAEKLGSAKYKCFVVPSEGMRVTNQYNSIGVEFTVNENGRDVAAVLCLADLIDLRDRLSAHIAWAEGEGE